MADAGTIIGFIILALFIVFIIVSWYKAVVQVKEKENVVIERLGVFRQVLTPGLHCIIPWIEYPKRYSFKYYVSNAMGGTITESRMNATRILTQNEVLDFPKQDVITRDNATISLDAVLNYRIVQPKAMIYSCQNLPHLLSKILQAQIRNVAGTLDVDQVIEDNAAMDRVSAQIDETAARWGVKVDFVKIQRVDTGALSSVLAKKKNADLKNKEVIINARAAKQTAVIESEGHRDRMIREAEGEAQQILSRARGLAQAILNNANAEARSVREIARVIASRNENPAKYLLALKYVEALRAVLSAPATQATIMPSETAFVQTVSALGLNTVAVH